MKKQQMKAVSVMLEGGAALAREVLEDSTDKRKIDHRKKNRRKRRKFRHQEALTCIKRDYLGIPEDPSTPLLGAEFKIMFRLSRTRFQVLMEDIQASRFQFSRFVKGIKEPITPQEKRYTGWQEACRKDVERAFGVLKATWQFLDRPILLH